MSALFEQIDWFPLRPSLPVAAIATVISLTLGLALAFAPILGSFRGRSLLEALATLPIVPPPTVLGYYLPALIGRRSPLGQARERECPAGDRRFRGEHARPRGREVGDVVGYCIRADRVFATPANGSPRAGRRGAWCDCFRRLKCRAKCAADSRARIRLTFLGLSMIREGEASHGKSSSRRRSEGQVDRLT